MRHRDCTQRSKPDAASPTPRLKGEALVDFEDMQCGMPEGSPAAVGHGYRAAAGTQRRPATGLRPHRPEGINTGSRI